MFDHIKNWKLLGGAHDFPGPDGGTCINEAAIIAAGFKYRRVDSASDCPPCFSRVISQYALCLNDYMPDATRQELLLPFVLRLAGTADTPQVELKRAEYIALHTIKRILPVALRSTGLAAHAEACEEARDITAAAYAAAAARAAAYDAAVVRAADAAARAAAAAAAADAAYAADAHAVVWRSAVQILSDAIELGNSGTEFDLGLVKERFELARELARA